MAQYLDLEGTKILVNKIKANTNNKLDKTANAVSASKLQTARTITLADNIVGNARFDGSGDITINARLTRQDLTGKTTDLNTLTHSDGTYSRRYIETTTGGCANISNAPVKEPFILDVELIRYSSSTDYISKQVFTSATTKKVYERYCTNGTWSSWGQVYTTTNKPTKADVGLGNVDNTSDLNKPISTATQNALNGKANSSHTHDDRYYTETEINDKLNGKANSSHTHTKSQITDMPTSLKNPTALTVQFNGTTNKTYDGSSAQTVNITPSAIGAAASSHGTHVPTPQTANNKKFLRNDNTWQDVTPANIGAAASSHTHDDRYFTETEINNKLSPITTSLNQLSNPNLLINGDFSVWQRGENFVANSNRYTADRWHIWYTTNHVISKLENGGIRIKINSSNYNYCEIIQAIDKVDIVALRGKKVTISCKVGESSSNFTKYYINVFFSTGVNLLANDGRISNSNKSVTSKGIIEHTFEVPVNANCMSIRVGVSQADTVENGGKDALAGKTLDINWVKLEAGSVATPFVPRPYAEELALCQRYYEKSYDVTVSPATDTGYGRYLISKNPIDNAFYGTIPFKVTKRTQPTIIAYKPNGTKLDISGVSSSTSTIDINVGSSSALLDLQWTADAEIY